MADLRSEPTLRRIKTDFSEVSPQSQYMALNEASFSQDVTKDTRQNTSPSAAQTSQYEPLLLSPSSWEVPGNQVTIEKIIGKGAFGQVAKGTLIGLQGRPDKAKVAIKMLKGVKYFYYW